MEKRHNLLKSGIGFIISGLFLYLAFRKLDFAKMMQALKGADYFFLLPSIFIVFFSHWVRALRWRYFLSSIKKVAINRLFSSLMIGYSANTVLPAHLGEFIRAYILGKKESIAASTIFATIAIERIIDVLSIIFVMAFTLIIYKSLPNWVKMSGYIMFVFAIVLIFFLIMLKIYTKKILKLVQVLCKPFPRKFTSKIVNITEAFIDGLKVMNRKNDYIIIIGLSIIIWFFYFAVFYINFYTFDFVRTYQLNVTAALVLLVITTISVVVPSSPGYVGTYHWLCQVSLELFSVPRSIGLTFAIVVHALTFFPVFLVGLGLGWKEGVGISKMTDLKNINEISNSNQLKNDVEKSVITEL